MVAGWYLAPLIKLVQKGLNKGIVVMYGVGVRQSDKVEDDGARIGVVPSFPRVEE